VDDDCLLAEDWVGQAARFAQEHAECGAFGGQVVPRWEAPPPPYVLRFGYVEALRLAGAVQRKRNPTDEC
jgi:hypothetical protein